MGKYLACHTLCGFDKLYLIGCGRVYSDESDDSIEYYKKHCDIQANQPFGIPQVTNSLTFKLWLAGISRINVV